MLFKKRKKAPSITREQALGCRPVKNSQVRENRNESGEVLLFYPLPNSPLVTGLVRKFGVPEGKPLSKKLQLDILGTAVWDLMDGNRSVAKIIKKFAGQYQLQHKEAEVSVTQFIRELGKRGLIALRRDGDL